MRAAIAKLSLGCGQGLPGARYTRQARSDLTIRLPTPKSNKFSILRSPLLSFHHDCRMQLFFFHKSDATFQAALREYM